MNCSSGWQIRAKVGLGVGGGVGERFTNRHHHAIWRKNGQLLTCVGDRKAVGRIQVVDMIVQMERFFCEILVCVV